MKAIMDTTRRAGSLQVGEIVNDDMSFDRIRIESILTTTDGTVVFTGQRLLFSGPQDRVTRYWDIIDRVTVHSWED